MYSTVEIFEILKNLNYIASTQAENLQSLIKERDMRLAALEVRLVRTPAQYYRLFILS